MNRGLPESSHANNRYSNEGTKFELHPWQQLSVLLDSQNCWKASSVSIVIFPNKKVNVL